MRLSLIVIHWKCECLHHDLHKEEHAPANVRIEGLAELCLDVHYQFLIVLLPVASRHRAAAVLRRTAGAHVLFLRWRLLLRWRLAVVARRRLLLLLRIARRWLLLRRRIALRWRLLRVARRHLLLLLRRRLSIGRCPGLAGWRLWLRAVPRVTPLPAAEAQ